MLLITMQDLFGLVQNVKLNLEPKKKKYLNLIIIVTKVTNLVMIKLSH